MYRLCMYRFFHGNFHRIAFQCVAMMFFYGETLGSKERTFYDPIQISLVNLTPSMLTYHLFKIIKQS